MPHTSSSPFALAHSESVSSAPPIQSTASIQSMVSIQSAAPILSVPPEILLELCRVSILENLDIWACSLVCKAWRAVFSPMARSSAYFSNVELGGLDGDDDCDYDVVEAMRFSTELERTRRLAALFAESARLGLDDCTHVRSILVNLCPLFDVELFLSIFATGLSNLHSLEIVYMYWTLAREDRLSENNNFPSPLLLHTFFTRLFPHCSSVEELIVSDRPYPHRVVPYSPHCCLNPLVYGLAPTLRILILSFIPADPGLEDALATCLSLEDVTFEGVCNADARRCLCVWPRLRCLGLRFTEPAEDALLEHVGEMYPGLTKLYLHGYWRRPAGGAGIAALVARCPGIRELILTNMEEIDDATLQVIVDQCTELESLHLTVLTKLTGAAVRLESVGWQKLEKLWLRGCVEIVSAFVRMVVAECPNLGILYLPEHLGQDDNLSEMLERMNFERLDRTIKPNYWTKKSRSGVMIEDA